MGINKIGARKVYEANKNIYNSLVLIGVLLVIGQMLLGSFISANNILLTLKLASFIAFFGLCQMIVMSTDGNGLDLSVGNIATLTAVVTAQIMNGSNQFLFPAILAALAIGAAIGLVNGMLTAYLKLPPLVVTLAIAIVLQGVLDLFSQSYNITGSPSPLIQTIAAKSSGDMFPNIIFILLIVIVATMFVMRNTKIGVKLFGVGANHKTAYFSGVNVKFTRCSTYIASGLIAGLIGLLLLGYMGTPMKDMGSSYVMPSVAAAVVGGVRGGNGNYLGVVLGAVFLQILSNLLIALGWGDGAKLLSYGVVLFILLIIYVREKRNR